VVGGGGVFFVGVGSQGSGSGGIRPCGDVLNGGVFEDCDDRRGGRFLTADFDGAACAVDVCLVFGAEVEGGLVVFVVVLGGWTEVGC
jgi:hypothetical protein